MADGDDECDDDNDTLSEPAIVFIAMAVENSNSLTVADGL
jgi:hypothetical protein